MAHYLSTFQQRVRENWNRPALCDYGGAEYSFGEVASQIEILHVLFKKLGIHKGDKVAICARNQARWGMTFLAINTYEAVVVPILADFHADSIAGIIDHSESMILFTDSDIWKNLDMGKMPGLLHAFDITDYNTLYLKGSVDKVVSYTDAQAVFNCNHPDGLKPEQICYPTDNAKDLAVINYTSGSTGDPKGVMIRYESLSANVEYGQANIASHPEDTILSILPMAHVFGMMFELIYPLCGGTSIHYLGKAPSPTLLMKAMAEVRPYLVMAVPMVFEKIYKSKLLPVTRKPSVKFLMHVPLMRRIIFKKLKGGLDAAFGGKVRTYILGGAAVNPEVEAFFKKIGLHFTVGYGMTEAAPLLAYVKWSDFRLRSCGRAIDCVELRIDSEDPARIPGEIQARGVNIFSGYYKNPEATRAAFTQDGWFNTGDLGIIDKEGNVFIKGRSKSMLLTASGQNIYPEEIECIVNSQDYAAESVVVMRNDRLVALVNLDADAIRKAGIKGEEAIAGVLENIRTNANRLLSRFSQISKVEEVKEPFEKTPKMSIKRFLYK